MMKNVISFFLFAILFSVGNAFVKPLGGSAAKAAATTRRASSDSSVSVWGVPASRDALVMMPATIEREAIKTGGPAVLDRPEVQQKEKKADSPVKERTREGNDAWEVRIYNDGMNTREHVARSLVQVTGLTELLAYQTMMRAHSDGIAVVGTYHFEVAEMYNEGLRKNGIISDIVPVDEES